MHPSAKPAKRGKPKRNMRTRIHIISSNPKRAIGLPRLRFLTSINEQDHRYRIHSKGSWVNHANEHKLSHAVPCSRLSVNYQIAPFQDLHVLQTRTTHNHRAKNNPRKTYQKSHMETVAIIATTLPVLKNIGKRKSHVSNKPEVAIISLMHFDLRGIILAQFSHGSRRKYDSNQYDTQYQVGNGTCN